jgi:hypothetical protein
MDKRQNIQSVLDEAWFDLLSEGGDSSRFNLGLANTPGIFGTATINVDGSIQVGERTFVDSVEAADFVVTGHACNFLKKEDDPE